MSEVMKPQGAIMRSVLTLVFALFVGGAQATCLSEIGAKKSRTLVKQCITISPATHPPCNAQNDCDLIRSEIERGCRLNAPDPAPKFCAPYLKTN